MRQHRRDQPATGPANHARWGEAVESFKQISRPITISGARRFIRGRMPYFVCHISYAIWHMEYGIWPETAPSIYSGKPLSAGGDVFHAVPPLPQPRPQPLEPPQLEPPQPQAFQAPGAPQASLSRRRPALSRVGQAMRRIAYIDGAPSNPCMDSAEVSIPAAGETDRGIPDAELASGAEAFQAVPAGLRRRRFAPPPESC